MEKDLKEIFKENLQLALQGNAEAQCRVAKAYWNGDGVKKSKEKAIGFYKSAAEQGLADAQFQLANYYDFITDLKEAIYWNLKAAQQGHVSAQYWMGYYYDEGEGVVRDIEKAIYWYAKSSEQGHDAAQERLGELLQDVKEKAEIYERIKDKYYN